MPRKHEGVPEMAKLHGNDGPPPGLGQARKPAAGASLPKLDKPGREADEQYRPTDAEYEQQRDPAGEGRGQYGAGQTGQADRRHAEKDGDIENPFDDDGAEHPHGR